MKITHKFTLHKNLKKNQLNSIINLKKQGWKYSKEHHKKWIKENLKKNDVHVQIYASNKLAGYTALRLRNLIVNKKKNYFFYFDTHIVNSKFRGKKVYKGLKISDLHMDKIKNFLKNKNILSMLLCKRSKLNYYRNSGWQRIFKSNYELNLKKKNLYLLIYPKQKNLYYTKYFI